MMHTHPLSADPVAQTWEDDILVKVPLTYDSVKSIELGGINFEDMNAVLYALNLILKSPNIEELQISVSHMPCCFLCLYNSFISL